MIGLVHYIKKIGYIWVVSKRREVRKYFDVLHKIMQQLVFYDISSISWICYMSMSVNLEKCFILYILKTIVFKSYTYSVKTYIPCTFIICFRLKYNKMYRVVQKSVWIDLEERCLRKKKYFWKKLWGSKYSENSLFKKNSLYQKNIFCLFFFCSLLEF